MRWWLSFAEEGKNLGIVIAEAESIKEAVDLCNKIGCNPGGEVLGVPMNALPKDTPQEIVDWHYNVQPYKLMPVKDLPHFLRPTSLGQAEANQLDLSKKAEFICKEHNKK